MWWENILDVCGYKIDIFCAIALISSMVHTKILSKCKFRRHFNVGSSTILIESLKFRNNSRMQWILPVIYCEDCHYEFFNIILCYYFSLEAVLQGMT